MSTRYGISRSYYSQRRAQMCVAAAVFVTATIALALFIVNVALVGADAYAEIYIVPQTTESDSADNGKASGVEKIDDEGNPLAASAGKSASSQGGFDFEMLIVLGIIVFVAFFVAWIIRLNNSMRKMDESMRSKRRLE